MSVRDSKEFLLLKRYFDFKKLPPQSRLYALRAWEADVIECIAFSSPNSNIINFSSFKNSITHK
jgi:hypothetical protein